MENIPKPSNEEVEKYLNLWDMLPNYVTQESSLKELFTETYPNNNCLNHILIKVCALNVFYSTNIRSPFIIANHIIALNIDDKLKENNLDIVNKIAKIQINKEKIINFYSFATKYCSHHKPEEYPIYDSYVEKMLIYWQDKDKFYLFEKNDFKNYPVYKNILLEFRKYYGLDRYNLKQIDKYLWQAGKEYFPKVY